ncbi:MAG TPA: hypothetical protein VF346_06680 [Bacteroidales bacterium]
MNKLFLMAVLIAAVLGSCKKDSTPKPICKIITATSSDVGTSAYNFSYNSDGTLNSSSHGSSLTTFSYSPNTIIETTTNGGAFGSKKTITLNANGLASNVRTENNVTGTSWNNTLYEYSGAELIKSTDSDSAGDPVDISTFTWSGGNLTSITGSSTETLAYYTDKPAQTGDYLSLIQLVFGYQIYRVKNALKSSVSGSSNISFSYTYDADGKITSVSVVSISTTTLTYQYQCN